MNDARNYPGCSNSFQIKWTFIARDIPKIAKSMYEYLSTGQTKPSLRITNPVKTQYRCGMDLVWWV